ncbi:hypothetical protein BGP_3124 [Beggiatoa sp. PS]|nr:hypothetical protein BGP_3124 [Beggiatoa sp. PS]
MSKSQQKPDKRDFSGKKKKVKEAQGEIREMELSKAVRIAFTGSDDFIMPNTVSSIYTIEAERIERQQAVANQVQTYRTQLKKLLEDFSKIPDPRRAKSVKHQLTVVLLYGLLSCLFQMASRREANRDMSRPAFLQALQGLFPELETLPHGDTLARVLERIEPQKLEESFIRLLRRYIRHKKFKRHLINKCYPIAIDGTQKLVRDGELGEEWLERHIKTKDGEKVQQYIYVLEANFVFKNGLTIPIMSEFLSYSEDDSKEVKQDCEIKAFKRLSHRLKKYFSPLKNYFIS